MKKIIGMVVISLLVFSSVSFSMDTSKITQENLDSFLTALPSYTQLMKEYDYDPDPSGAAAMSQELLVKVNALLKKYGFTLQSFAVLSSRIMAAYGQAEMKAQGFGGMMPQIVQTSTEEDKIISSNLNKIRATMEAQG